MRSSPEEGFAKLEELGAIREVHVFDRSQVVADLHREFRTRGQETLIVAGTHEEISHINGAIRQDRRSTVSLGWDARLTRMSPYDGRPRKSRIFPTINRGSYFNFSGILSWQAATSRSKLFALDLNLWSLAKVAGRRSRSRRGRFALFGVRASIHRSGSW
jgi:hypothetical protein